MKVLIGVDPHKGAVAIGAIDEAKGQLLERASFPQNRAGLRRLGHWREGSPSAVGLWRTQEASGVTWRGGWRARASRWLTFGELREDEVRRRILLRGWVNKPLLVNHQYPLPSVTTTVTREVDRNDP